MPQDISKLIPNEIPSVHSHKSIEVGQFRLSSQTRRTSIGDDKRVGMNTSFNSSPGDKPVTQSNYEMEDAFRRTTTKSSTDKKGPHKVGKSIQKASSLKWPEGKPKRPLTAYNYFFQHERQQAILSKQKNGKTGDDDPPPDKTTPAPEDGSAPKKRRRRHRKTSGLGFASLAQNVAEKWKALSDAERKIFQDQAENDKKRYHSELNQWNKKRTREKFLEQFSSPAAAPMYPTPATQYYCSPSFSIPVATTTLDEQLTYARQANLTQSLASTQQTIETATIFLEQIQNQTQICTVSNTNQNLANATSQGTTNPHSCEADETSSLDTIDWNAAAEGTQNLISEFADIGLNESTLPIPIERDSVFNESIDADFAQFIEECDF